MAPAHYTALVQAFFLWEIITSPRSVRLLQPSFGSLRLLAFPRAKIAFEREEICECDGHTVHKLSQRRLTADWLDPRENNCSRMHSKIFYDWLPSYIKDTRPVLEIFKMAGYFPDSPRKHHDVFVCAFGAVDRFPQHLMNFYAVESHPKTLCIFLWWAITGLTSVEH